MGANRKLVFSWRSESDLGKALHVNQSLWNRSCDDWSRKPHPGATVVHAWASIVMCVQLYILRCIVWIRFSRLVVNLGNDLDNYFLPYGLTSRSWRTTSRGHDLTNCYMWNLCNSNKPCKAWSENIKADCVWLRPLKHKLQKLATALGLHSDLSMKQYMRLQLIHEDLFR